MVTVTVTVTAYPSLRPPAVPIAVAVKGVMMAKVFSVVGGGRVVPEVVLVSLPWVSVKFVRLVLTGVVPVVFVQVMLVWVVVVVVVVVRVGVVVVVVLWVGVAVVVVRVGVVAV